MNFDFDFEQCSREEFIQYFEELGPIVVQMFQLFMKQDKTEDEKKNTQTFFDRLYANNFTNRALDAFHRVGCNPLDLDLAISKININSLLKNNPKH